MNKIILCCLCLATSQTFALTPTSFRFSRDLAYEGQSQQVLLAVPLDPAVYAGSATDFRDLRIVDQNGVEIPYLLNKISDSKNIVKRLPIRITAPTLERTAGDGIVVSLDLEVDEIAHAAGMTISTSQRDFEYKLKVEGSVDGISWHTLVDNAAIYDYSRFMKFGNQDVELSENNDRHFKITVEKPVHSQVAQLKEFTQSSRGGEELSSEEKVDIVSQALHIERIELWRTESETVSDAERRFEYPISDFSIKTDSEKKKTEIDVRAHLLPLNGFELKISTPNFNRTAEVQVPLTQGIETRMSAIGRTTLAALHFKDFTREQLSLFFPEQRRQNYKIIIDDQDNPPLKIDQVVGLGPGYQLLFLPKPNQTYRLLYGFEKAPAPRYEVQPIQELLRRGFQTTNSSLGPEVSATVKDDRFDLAQLLNSNGFLITVIALMVLVLAWSLYRVAKRIG